MLAEQIGRDYGLAIERLRAHPVGFESECWVADDTWFVKIWRRSDPPAGLQLLDELAAAGLPVPTAIRTRAGEPHALWRGRPYAIFPYVHGHPEHPEDWRIAARALRSVHNVHTLPLPPATMDEPEIRELQVRLDHSWIRDRRAIVAENIDRLDRAIERARTKEIPRVLCHRDFGGDNLIVDGGRVVAILDWEQAVIGPREHDLWIAAEMEFGAEFLTEYGAYDLDPDHIEYALLARALRDMAARVLAEVDRPGVDTWGFRRIGRLERDLDLFRPFCRARQRPV